MESLMAHDAPRRSFRPPFLCFVLTLLIPLLWIAVMQGLEVAGKDDLALAFGWITIPLVFVTVPLGLLTSLVLAVAGRNDK